MVKKVLECDRYLVADLDDMQRNQRRFESVFASDKMKPWCSLGPEADLPDDDINDLDGGSENGADNELD